MLSTYYVPETVLDARDSEVNKSLNFSGGGDKCYTSKQKFLRSFHMIHMVFQ